MVDTPMPGGDNLSALGELNTTSLKTTQWHALCKYDKGDSEGYEEDNDDSDNKANDGGQW